MAATIGADSAPGTAPDGNGHQPDGNGEGHHANGNGAQAAALLRALGEAGTAATRAAWEHRPRGVRDAVMPAHLPTREWLARASFCLLGIAAIGLIALAALGLLASGEAAALALPVVAITSLVLGFYLGNESGGKRAEG